MNACKTCSYTCDTGGKCNSAAVIGQNYCTYHLRHRARQMRIAQARARNERFDLTLPPLESMFAVQSALAQLADAVAADMIDLKRAHFLLSLLRAASQNLRHAEKWQPNVFHSDQPAPAVDLVADFGLPQDLDIDTPPEVAFPQSVILNKERSDESKDPFVPADRVGSSHTTRVGVFPSSVNIPVVQIPVEMETTPADIELEEIMKTRGFKVWEARANEHQRNQRRREQRRYFRANYERFAAEAKARNIRRAAEQLLRDKLASEKAAAETEPVGCPVQVREAPLSGDSPDPGAVSRKPPASAEVPPDRKEATTA